jgi:hypothetical protein
MGNSFKILVILSFSLVFLLSDLHAESFQPRQRILASGETILKKESESIKIKIIIKTHELQNQNLINRKTTLARSICAYTRYPCSIVDYIDIVVNDKPIFVDRNVYCDLEELNTGEISIGAKKSSLTLTGGDGADAYIVNIEFDTKRVLRRTLASLMMPDEPLQETNYFLRILD